MGIKLCRKPEARVGLRAVWILKRLAVMAAGLMFFYGAGTALGASEFSASATLQSSGGVVISWQDPGTQAVGGLSVSITGSDHFTEQDIQFTSGQMIDPNGQAGTTYNVTENDANTGQEYSSVQATAASDNPIYNNNGGGQSTGTQDDQGSPMERFLAIPINAIATAIGDLAGLVPLDQLIFTSNAFLNQNAWNVAMQWYSGLTLYAVLAMAVVLLFLAWQSSRAVNEQDRAEAQKAMWRWGFGFLLLYLTPWLATAVFTVNGALVQFAQLQLHGISVDNSVATGNVLSDAFIALYMAGLKLYFNILYVVRAVFTLLLLAIAPIVTWTYVLNPTRQSFIMWSAELFSNIMMQAAHALTLSFFFAILTVLQGAAAGSGVSGILGQWWAKIVIITLVIPIGQFLRNLINMWLNVFGVPEERIAAGATAGIAGIMGLPKVLGAVSGLKFGGVAAGLAGAGGAGLGGGTPSADGAGGGFNIPLGGGDDGGAGAIAANAAGAGFAHAQNYSVAGRAAAALGGVLGATVGMPFGESRAFAMGGAAAGRRLVSNIGQAHQALAQMGKGGTDHPASVVARAAGALIAGAGGGHMAAGVANAAVAKGSQLLYGPEGIISADAPVVPQSGVGGGTTAPVAPAGSAISSPGGTVTGQAGASPAPASDVPSGSQVSRPAAGLGGNSARRIVMVENDNAAGDSFLADRPLGLEDIIDFHRLL